MSSRRSSWENECAPYSSFGSSIVRVPLGVDVIGEHCFKGTDVKFIWMPHTVRSLSPWCFANCADLVGVVLSNNILNIPDRAFFGCTSLFHVILPGKLQRVGCYAFSGCTRITSLTLPRPFHNLQYHAFSSCTSLLSVEIPGRFEKFPNAFLDCPSLCAIICPGREDFFSLVDEQPNDRVRGGVPHSVADTVESRNVVANLRFWSLRLHCTLRLSRPCRYWVRFVLLCDVRMSDTRVSVLPPPSVSSVAFYFRVY
jgi:hypothetical protein